MLALVLTQLPQQTKSKKHAVTSVSREEGCCRLSPGPAGTVGLCTTTMGTGLALLGYQTPLGSSEKVSRWFALNLC